VGLFEADFVGLPEAVISARISDSYSTGFRFGIRSWSRRIADPRRDHRPLADRRVRLNKPTVRDEIHMGLDYFPMSLFDALPRLFAELEESMRDLYDTDAELPELLSFGSGSAATATATPSLPRLHSRRGQPGAPSRRRPLHRRNHPSDRLSQHVDAPYRRLGSALPAHPKI